MLNKVTCLYHRPDLDGHCSAAITRKYFKEKNINFAAIDVNYNDPIEKILNELDKDTILIIVDYSLSLEHFDIAHRNAGQIIWIDHHKSAIERVEHTIYSKLEGIRDTSKAACELTWSYFYPDKHLPITVELLGRYDIWDNSVKSNWDNSILPFQYGMKMDMGLTLNDDKIDWDDMLESDNEIEIYDIINDGNLLIKNAYKNNKIIVESSAYESIWEGLRCLVVNASTGGSSLFDSVEKRRHINEYDIYVTWRLIKDKWVIGLYRPYDDSEVDCSKLATKYGGGGHIGAAGFTLPIDRSPLSIFKP